MHAQGLERYKDFEKKYKVFEEHTSRQHDSNTSDLAP